MHPGHVAPDGDIRRQLVELALYGQRLATGLLGSLAILLGPLSPVLFRHQPALVVEAVVDQFAAVLVRREDQRFAVEAQRAFDMAVAILEHFEERLDHRHAAARHRRMARTIGGVHRRAFGEGHRQQEIAILAEPLGRIGAVDVPHVAHFVLRRVMLANLLQQLGGQSVVEPLEIRLGTAEFLAFSAPHEREPAAQQFRPAAAMEIELLPPHRLEAAGRDLGHQRKDVRSAEGGEAGAGGGQHDIRHRPADEARFGEALGHRRSQRIEDQHRVEIGLVKRIEMHIGRQVARRRDEAPGAAVFVEALQVRPVLYVQPVMPVGHVIEARLVNDYPLVDELRAEADETVRDFLRRVVARVAPRTGTVRTRRGRRRADQHELRDIGSFQRALGRAAKDGLRGEFGGVGRIVVLRACEAAVPLEGIEAFAGFRFFLDLGAAALLAAQLLAASQGRGDDVLA